MQQYQLIIKLMKSRSSIYSKAVNKRLGANDSLGGIRRECQVELSRRDKRCWSMSAMTRLRRCDLSAISAVPMSVIFA